MMMRPSFKTMVLSVTFAGSLCIGLSGMPSAIAASTCKSVTPLTCDLPLTKTLETPTATDCFTFSVPEGTRVHLRVLRESPSGTNFNPSWRLVKADGTAATTCGTSSVAIDRDCGPLPASDNPYRLEVEDGQHNDTGTYGVYLQRLTAGATCDTTPIACDASVTGSINVLDTDLLSLPNVPGGTWVHIRGNNKDTPGVNLPAWRLLDKTGAPVAGNCATFGTPLDRDCGPLPASGNPYRLEVEATLPTLTMTYRLHLQNLTAGAACENTPVGCSLLTRSIDNPLDTDLFSFSVANGARVHISTVQKSPSGPKFEPIWRLLTGAGVQVAGNCGFFSFPGQDRDCGPLPASGNPYRVEVQDFQGNDIGTYDVRVCPQ